MWNKVDRVLYGNASEPTGNKNTAGMDKKRRLAGRGTLAPVGTFGTV